LAKRYAAWGGRKRGVFKKMGDGVIKSSKIEEIEKKINQLRARKAAEEAKLKKKAKKEDTRRKILIGAYFLDKAERNGGVEALYREIDSFLTRENDRKLFGLPAIED
jgi:large subunit ribosomal protein L7/L12